MMKNSSINVSQSYSKPPMLQAWSKVLVTLDVPLNATFKQDCVSSMEVGNAVVSKTLAILESSMVKQCLTFMFAPASLQSEGWLISIVL